MVLRLLENVDGNLRTFGFGGGGVEGGWVLSLVKGKFVCVHNMEKCRVGEMYEGWNFNSGNYLFTTDTKWIHVSKFYCPSV